MRILFMGTTPFALPSLQSLSQSPEHEIIGVVTQPDRPQGRGGKLAMSSVKSAALALGLPVFQPEKVRAKDFVQLVRELAPDALVVAAFGQIIPQRMLDIPPVGSINIHGSLLPRWRGAAPMQYSLMAGDPETGVTTMQMDAGLDTGDILLQASLPLTDEDNLGTLEPKLAELGANLLMETLEKLTVGTCPRTVQNEALVTLSPSLPPDLGALDWGRSARDLHNLVRGVTPRPGAYTFWQGKRLKVWRTAATATEGSAGPGVIESITAQGIIVGTGSGLLRILEVQPESKGRMDAAAWARGARLAAGQQFDNADSSVKSGDLMDGIEERLARGIACKIEGRYDEAVTELKSVADEDPAHAEAHHQLGLVYGFIGLFDESVAELEHAARLDPGNTLARNDLALTYTMLGMYEEAKVEFARVLERDRQNDVALRNLTYLP